MGKAPAFQFYVKDWLSDPELQSASASTRGLWVNALCYMWEARERGKLTGTEEELAKLLRATNGDFTQFMNDVKRHKFADVTKCNNEVTLVNRRMQREQSERENTRLRVRRHRSNAECNANVTPPSPSPSPSPTPSNLKEQAPAPFVLPSKEEINEASDVLILKQIETVSLELYKGKIFPEVSAFKNKMLKQKKNPRSILHTLCRAYLKREFEEGPWAYCLKIIEMESAKYNARDYGKTAPKVTR